jgi:microsomal epoxide hydrolase
MEGLWLVRLVPHPFAHSSCRRRKVEDDINSFPNYTGSLEHKGHSYKVHFLALYSRKKDAIPIVMTHGWPGSVLEFLPLLHHLSKTYTPETLPVHVVVPSLIGYGFSSPPPVDDDFTTRDNAALFDKLMTGLGFKNYIAQGGDVGSLVSSTLGAEYPACKGKLGM